MSTIPKIGESLKGGINRLGSYALLAILIILIVSALRNIGKVTQIRQDIKDEKARVSKMEVENRELEKQVRDVQGVEFIEAQIRNKLGLVKEGEAVVILPEPEILKKLAPTVSVDSDALPDPNWRKWLKLFI